MELGMQIWSLKEQFSDLASTADLDAALSFCAQKKLEYVEPLPGANMLKQLKHIAQQGLKASTATYLIDDLQNCRQQDTEPYGIRDYILMWSNPESEAELEELVRQLREISLSLKAQGIKLHYHNHVHELMPSYTKSCIMDILLEQVPDLYWEIDVGWVAAAGLDVVQAMRRWQGRIQIIHLRDVAAKLQQPFPLPEDGMPKHMGEGIVPFAAILREAKRQGVERFFLEHTNPADLEGFVESGQALLAEYWCSNNRTKRACKKTLTSSMKLTVA